MFGINVCDFLVARHCLKSLKSILKVAFDKKNYRQPRDAGSGRNSLPQERAPMPNGQP